MTKISNFGEFVNEVSHEKFFGENIARIRKGLFPKKTKGLIEYFNKYIDSVSSRWDDQYESDIKSHFDLVLHDFAKFVYKIAIEIPEINIKFRNIFNVKQKEKMLSQDIHFTEMKDDSILIEVETEYFSRDVAIRLNFVRGKFVYHCHEVIDGKFPTIHGFKTYDELRLDAYRKFHIETVDKELDDEKKQEVIKPEVIKKEKIIPKEGKIYKYKGANVIVTNVVENRERVEVSRDLIHKWNPFFIYFDELEENPIENIQRNSENTSTFDSYKYK